MPFQQAILACGLGNLMLIVVATLLGIISCRTGLTTSVLARKSMGGRSSAILSFLLAVSAVNWIAVNADTFAKLIGSTFSWWPIPVGITAIIVVALWAQSAIRGVNGLEIVSWLGVPCAIVLTIACAIAIGTKAGYASVFAYTPPSDLQISFAAGSTSFVGAWIFGCIVSPDVCRYAKSPKRRPPSRATLFPRQPLSVWVCLSLSARSSVSGPHRTTIFTAPVWRSKTS